MKRTTSNTTKVAATTNATEDIGNSTGLRDIVEEGEEHQHKNNNSHSTEAMSNGALASLGSLSKRYIFKARLTFKAFQT